MHKLQVVVAESFRARFYQSTATPHSLELVDSFTNPAARAHEQDLVSDRPGRMVDRGLGHTVSFGNQHSARETALDRHARRIARRIGGLGAQEQDSRLVLIASGRLLGLIRAQLSAASARRLVAEIPRDLTHLNMHELELAVAEAQTTECAVLSTRPQPGSTTMTHRHR